MGSGASKNKPKNNLRTKVLAVGALGSNEKVNKTSSSSSDLPAGRTIVIKDTSAAWDLLRGGTATVDTENLATEQLTFDSANNGSKTWSYTKGEDAEDSTGIPYDIDNEIKQDTECDICKTDNGFVQYPCRICTRVYHEQCLRSIGQCQDERSVSDLHKATSDVGWTCHLCENINTVLTEDEMTGLVQDFDELDVNHDSEVSRSEFIQYKKDSFLKRYGVRMSDGEIDMEMNRFDCIDTDSTGTINWWEFLNYESVACLQRRKRKNSIVAMLSPKEIQRAREGFHVFDVDRNGNVTEREAREAYASWYRKHVADRRNGPTSSAAIDSHVDSSVKVLMTADDDDTGVVSWDEYLRDKAVNYISARPNSVKIFEANHIGYGLVKSTSYKNLGTTTSN